MSCNSPLTAYRSRDGGITFSRNASITKVPLSLPCGQCTGCRLEHSRQWAMRCVHEAKMHKENCVLSLSYNPEKLPENLSLVKRDLQLFFKRMRKAVGRFRYYACGEYGERSRRPHYHAAIFGFDVVDKKFYKRSKIGTSLYTSELMNDIWGNGFVVVGEMNFESAAYIARYVVDKMTGDMADMWYSWIDDDGVWHDVEPEFAVMSRRPGIGTSYYKKYGAEVLAHDSVVMRGQVVRPPRFYDKLSDAVDPKRMEVLKRKRRREAMKHREDNTPERRRVKERHLILSLKQKQKVEL